MCPICSHVHATTGFRVYCLGFRLGVGGWVSGWVRALTRGPAWEGKRTVSPTLNLNPNAYYPKLNPTLMRTMKEDGEGMRAAKEGTWRRCGCC